MSALRHRLRSNIAMIVCVIGLTLFIHLSTLFGILVPWLYPFESFASKLLFISLNGSTVLILLNYYLCVVVDPGFVSPSYKPPPTTSAHLTPIVQTPNNVDPSNDTLTPFFCDRCQLYKPPRAHHCRQCNRCILRMDHHCVWIASCVGFNNQPHFVRFLFWTCVSCWICIVVLIMRLESVLFGVVHGQKQLEMQEMVGELIIVGINFVVLTPTVSILTMLAYNQFHLLLTNQTTIESLNQSKRASFAYSGKRVDLSFHPYDLGGWIDNVNQVLGSNIFSWLVDFQALTTIMKKKGTMDSNDSNTELGDEEVWRQEGHWFPISKKTKEVLDVTLKH